ncbi:MAG: phosphoribosylformylglycinamidine synthase subunit PurQ [Thermoguttaceae bacterium]|nr:phosphoribosylformylglycinamidine synthase subunit PurQ [Thermoguttaceae bacterium]MDW8039625.1 phosphoribosylformylglycinamidine synthase subunit PurQ [Thermoguttaceae bacterium]
MALPRVLILRAPGTNCDVETAFAFEKAGAKAERLHVFRLLENPQLCRTYQIFCIPGGFSYGDDIAAGRILANQIRLHLADLLREFVESGKLILGICNGFQVLVKSDVLLPPTQEGLAQATLTWNDSRRFEDRWVRLAVTGRPCVFLEGIQELYLPVAHAEGKFVARDIATLQALESAGLLVLRYARLTGPLRVESQLIPYPENPNGSQANVAGLCDSTGRILGLMPHPERHIDPTHHPHWTRRLSARLEGLSAHCPSPESSPSCFRPPAAEGDGLRLFKNAVRYFA